MADNCPVAYRVEGDRAMLKKIVCIGVIAGFVIAPFSVVAQTGYGVKPGAPSTSTFDRSWNRANESKDRARASAEYMRHRRLGTHHHHPASQ
jgi:hypothetical protein